MRGKDLIWVNAGKARTQESVQSKPVDLSNLQPVVRRVLRGSAARDALRSATGREISCAV